MMSPRVGMGRGATPFAGCEDGDRVLVMLPLCGGNDRGGRGGPGGGGGLRGGLGGGGGDGGGNGGKGGDGGERGGGGAEHWQSSTSGFSGEVRSSQPADKHFV